MDYQLNDRQGELVTLAAARAGQPAAFEAIYRRYERQIHAFVFRMMGDTDDAHDLTADAFVKVWGALPRLQPDTNISAFVHRVATNVCLDILRRRQRVRWLPWEAPKHEHLRPASRLDEPEDAAVSREARVTVQAALAAMSHRHRAGLILREYEGLSCEEIGEVMGLSRSAVKSMLFRAREEFRLVYRRLDPTMPAERPRVIAPRRAKPRRPVARPWTPDEDAALLAARVPVGGWAIVGERLGRSGDGCRKRANYLAKRAAYGAAGAGRMEVVA